MMVFLISYFWDALQPKASESKSSYILFNYTTMRLKVKKSQFLTKGQFQERPKYPPVPPNLLTF